MSELLAEKNRECVSSERQTQGTDSYCEAYTSSFSYSTKNLEIDFKIAVLPEIVMNNVT